MRHPIGPFFQDPAVPPGGAGAGGTRVCEFCQCTLAGDGGVLRMSARARELVKVEDALEKARAELATATARVAELAPQLAAAEARLAALPTPAPSDRPRGGLSFDN